MEELSLNERVALAIGAKKTDQWDSREGTLWHYATQPPNQFWSERYKSQFAAPLLPFDSDWNAAIWAWQVMLPDDYFQVTRYATPERICKSIIDIEHFVGWTDKKFVNDFNTLVNHWAVITGGSRSGKTVSEEPPDEIKGIEHFVSTETWRDRDPLL